MILDEIIKSEIEKLNELESLLNTEREILIKNDGEKVSGIVEKKKKFTDEIRDIENERIKISGKASSKDCVKKGMLNNEICDKLIETVNRIKQKSETNMALTKQSLTYIRTITNILRPGQPVITYKNNGYVGDGRNSGLFTTKA